ncbi:MAG TPA: tetratricopeptide repeat protein, partial [Myxococcales bacterium]|nr:tetratricopeptide repeat protein [Myxococcales bacterium]
VSREDEISLTGESWKRLGNIAELASFFQVVDEAQKAQQLAALQSAGVLGYVPPGGTPSGGYAIPSGDLPPAPMSIPGPAAFRPSTGTPSFPLQGGMQSAAMSAALPLQPQVNVTVNSPQAAAPPAPAAAVTREDLEAAQIRKGGGASRALIAVLALAVLGGGGYFAYTGWWVPQQEAKERDAQAKLEAERKGKEDADRKAKEEADRKAKEEAERKAKEDAAKAAAAAVAVPDAGTPTAAPGSEDTLLASGKKGFDYWMTAGDRLREREKPEKALDAYGRAADLNPDRAEPHAGRGLALMDMGNKLAAEAAFLQALKLNPRYGVALMGLAETYRTEGKNDEAKKYYEQYLDVLPSGPEATVARQALQRLQQ